tara:strand:+ start:373 stop:1023 length:651 start_codon:yes stop_codon:yes gene_type:complete
MKAKLKVPNKLSEITLGQYQKYLKIQDKNEDPYFLQCKLIEIFCNLDAKSVRLMRVNDVSRISNIINQMFDKQTNLVRNFSMSGTDYGFIPDLENMTFGEYIDLDSYINDWKNMHVAMNVLYRPIKSKVGEKYLIEDYKIDTKDNMLKMPMNVVLGSISFFFRLGLDLSKVMTNYLDNNQREDLTAYLSSIGNGDGINQFMHSLEEILQNSKISLN